ncbi:helix-turn-helix domain-containing protein [Paraglaciecola hydrolytica]|uniref:HTH cro/C1-type domain-containing protein n=1 Tax=Paraglaciecola hydrolytica TaxID=1799789 RepID=A0A136A1U4_9ALTE|nr:helix-turn-helix transcriptional regulator [Paraglaciecola hydrolytica]KXI29120.1 hypothetical protein AX660_13245 [Paraglaciecola hydrolytica]
MTLGKRIRNLRAHHNLSQPELAEKIGIEQSYLSKLENDKSLPSNEIFNNILRAFNLSLEQFLIDFEPGSTLENLKLIPDVAQHYGFKQKVNMQQQRRFLYISSLLIVLATSIFYIGYSKVVFPERHYEYESEGVVLAGENQDIFHNWRRLMPVEQAKNQDTVDKLQVEMEQRKQQTILISPTNRGKQFVVAVDGGTRLYQINTPILVPQSINAWLQVLGVLLFSGGIMGFVLERRIYKLR